MLIVANIRVGLNGTSDCPDFLRRVCDSARDDEDKVLIIVGSLTATAAPEEFAIVKSIFSELVAAGITVIAVPGAKGAPSFHFFPLRRRPSLPSSFS